MKGKSDYYNLILSAFLHDIGKFAQRAGMTITSNTKQEADIFLKHGITHDSHKHVLYTYQFLKEEKFSESIINLASAHHQPQNEMAEIIQKADWLSSSERLTNQDQQESFSFLKRHLVPLFSEIKFTEEFVNRNFDANFDLNIYKNEDASRLRYNLRPLELKKDVVFPASIQKEDNQGEFLENDNLSLREKYRKLWENFIQEFRALPSFENVDFENHFHHYFSTLYFLMLKYSWSIPSAIYKSTPDISLFNHSKSTTALAAALYKNKENQKQHFTGISVDLSGIQNFIYNITNKAGFTSLIRGRSFLVSQMINLTAHYILDELDLPITNLLYAGGGNLLILSYELGDDVLKKLETNIQQAFFQKFGSELIPVFASINVDKNDIENFDRFYDKIHKASNNKKNKKHFHILQDIFLIQEDSFIPASQICRSCNKNIITENNRCDLCNVSNKISQELLHNEYLVIAKNGESLFSMKFGDKIWGFSFFSGADLPNYAEGQFVFKINDTNNFYSNNNKTGFGFTFFGNTVPQNKDRTLSFEELAKGGKLALFKGDIDNLGLLFNPDVFPRDNNKNNKFSMSRLLDLSFLTDLYFSGYVNTLIKENFFNKIYLMYSGGDDIMAVGHWEDLIQFVQEFNAQFRNFTCFNSFIHLSGGVEIFKAKYPIYDVVKKVNILEEKAKNKDFYKDKIAIFGDVVFWDNTFRNKKKFDDFNSLVSFGKKLFKFEKKKKISSGLVYSLLQLKLAFHIGEKEGENLMWIPYLAYMLTRNVKTRKDDELFQFVEYLKSTSVMSQIKIPAYYFELKNRERRKDNAI